MNADRVLRIIGLVAIGVSAGVEAVIRQLDKTPLPTAPERR